MACEADRQVLESSERLAALANNALRLMASGIAAAQEVSAMLAVDVLELAEMVPSEQREAAAGAVARARQILGHPGERH